MSLPALDNLVRTGQLKAAPRNDDELARMLARARGLLTDAAVSRVSVSTRFTCAYSAGHAAALAALRWHGYRSENRYIVFQCLTHTLGWNTARWRVLDAAHRKRNLAEYEGFLEVEESVIAQLCALAAELITDVERLTQT